MSPVSINWRPFLIISLYTKKKAGKGALFRITFENTREQYRRQILRIIISGMDMIFSGSYQNVAHIESDIDHI